MMNFYYTESIDVLMLSQRKKNLLIFNEYKLLLGILRIVTMCYFYKSVKSYIKFCPRYVDIYFCPFFPKIPEKNVLKAEKIYIIFFPGCHEAILLYQEIFMNYYLFLTLLGQLFGLKLKTDYVWCLSFD